MRYLGLMTVRNEMHRYLASSLEWHKWFFDEMFVYDDRSDDGSAEYAAAAGATVVIRNPDDPSFLEHEGQFRQNSWEQMEKHFQPTEEDWIFLLDADEFLISRQDAPVQCMESAITYAEKHGHDAIFVTIPEVWEIDELGAPLIRMDGFWKNLALPRLVKYHKEAKYYKINSDQDMIWNTYPETTKSRSEEPYGLTLLHFGYVDQNDRQEKYTKYTEMNLRTDKFNTQHLNSILDTPFLATWLGPHPPVKRGIA